MSSVVRQFYDVFETIIVYLDSCDFTVCSTFSDFCTDEFFRGINYDTTIALSGILSL